MAIVVDNELPEKLSHNHFLYLNTADTSGVVLVSIQLTGSENYFVWSRSMRIAILGRNKLGFIDGRCRKENFGPNLSDLWERCNAIVLSWIMNCVSKELLSGIVYSSDACAVWNDLKERFDKADGSRIFQLHREIATMSQGTSSISEYFTRLQLRWAEFDSLAPFPDCNYAGSRGFMDFMNRQKLLQFFMGLNESYEQARGHILMLIPIPSVNQTYSMMIERESQRNMTNVTSQAMNMEIAAFSSGRGTHNNNKPKKNWNVQCDHCKIMGHIKSDCYRLIGYPPGRGPASSNFTQTQYNQMVQHMDNPNHYEQFQRIIDREKVGEPSANMSSMEVQVQFPATQTTQPTLFSPTRPNSILKRPSNIIPERQPHSSSSWQQQLPTATMIPKRQQLQRPQIHGKQLTASMVQLSGSHSSVRAAQTALHLPQRLEILSLLRDFRLLLARMGATSRLKSKESIKAVDVYFNFWILVGNLDFLATTTSARPWEEILNFEIGWEFHLYPGPFPNFRPFPPKSELDCFPYKIPLFFI